MEDHIDPEELLSIVTEFMSELNDRFGEHLHLLDWSLHLDESTPHIHERHVFDCENDYGEMYPQQEKALELLGFNLPDPEKKAGRFNNRKMVFEAGCKFEYMLCLVGDQGAGKSSFFRFLAVRDEWFSDDLKKHPMQNIQKIERDNVCLSGHRISRDEFNAASINRRIKDSLCKRTIQSHK